MSDLTINVTQTDIDEGSHGSPCYCAVALAFHRALKEANIEVAVVEVSPGLVQAYVDRKQRAARQPMGIWHLPIEVRTFISLFDNRIPVSPFQFIATEGKVT